ncbi:MAG: nucleotide exchange factor GrpE [SAR324 cluster bacterium]
MSGTDEKDTAPRTEEGEAADAAAGTGMPGGNGSGGNGTQAPPEGTGAEFPVSEPSEADVLRAELDKVKAQLAERFDANLRLQAEFENFKKRMFKEQAEQLKYAQLPLLRELTQAMDNLERALTHIRTQGSAEAKGLAGGIEMVAKQLGDTFERFGMVRLKTEGADFDPTRHEAVSVVETDRVPDNRVLQEFQAGYVLHDRVVRPAMVSVAKKAGGAAPGGESGSPKGEPAGPKGEAGG